MFLHSHLLQCDPMPKELTFFFLVRLINAEAERPLMLLNISSGRDEREKLMPDSAKSLWFAFPWYLLSVSV